VIEEGERRLGFATPNDPRGASGLALKPAPFGQRRSLRGRGGHEFAFHGEYREIVPNERIVATEVNEGAPEGDAQVAISLP
jgi:uncharacterized protein YndB with AHSA1/START domain